MIRAIKSFSVFAVMVVIAFALLGFAGARHAWAAGDSDPFEGVYFDARISVEGSSTTTVADAHDTVSIYGLFYYSPEDWSYDDSWIDEMVLVFHSNKSSEPILVPVTYYPNNEMWKTSFEVTYSTTPGYWALKEIRAYDSEENEYIFTNVRQNHSPEFLGSIDEPSDSTAPTADLDSIKVEIPHDKQAAFIGDTVKVSAAINDEAGGSGVRSVLFQFIAPRDDYSDTRLESYRASYDDTTGRWVATIDGSEIDRSGTWKLFYLTVGDYAGNELLYDSEDDYAPPAPGMGYDLSAGNFVVKEDPSTIPSVRYRTGVEGTASWQGWVQDGQVSGTVGLGLRMEGLQIELANADEDSHVVYETQLQSEGWRQGEVRDGATSGHEPKSSGGLRAEAVKIHLEGPIADEYDIWYHLQVQRFGWMGWAKNGEAAGTVGYAFRVEAIEIVLRPKGLAAPSTGNEVATPDANMLSYIRCRSYDNKTWQGPKGEGDVSGTRNQTKTCVRVGLAQSGLPNEYKGNSGVQVRVYQDGKWTSWTSADDQEIGNKKGGSIRGIQARLTGDMADDYDLYYRTEIREDTDKGACWLGWAKNGETAGQSNRSLEQIEFAVVEKSDPSPTASNNPKQRWVLERWPCNYFKAAYRF